jgi:carotenoid cleavage dioxygenase
MECDAPDLVVEELLVFEALNIDQGPLATAKLPVRIPAGFHGTFVAA